MSTTVDKLNYLDDTKSAIREAIENKGVSVSNSDTFRSYAEKIDSIVVQTIPDYPTGKIENGNGATCYYSRTGDMVTVTVTNIPSNTPSWGMGYLPEDYRPFKTENVLTYLNQYSASAVYPLFSASKISVGYDGGVSCIAANNGGSSIVWGTDSMSISFVAANASINQE